MIDIQNLCRNFGGLKALAEVSLTVPGKSIYGLIGPNGAGKTTLFNLITGFIAPTAGTISFCGQRIDRRPPHAITKMGIARTFQNIRLFQTLTVWENIRVAQNIHAPSGIASLFRPQGKKEREFTAKAEELLHRLGLWEKRYQQSPSLSYGEQRRLEIARALALEPQLLLLDEPAAGMNEAESEDLLERICEIRDTGKTVLMIEHDMKVVMGICDRIAVLNFGCLIAEGTPAAIQSNDDVVEAYLGKEEELA